LPRLAQTIKSDLGNQDERLAKRCWFPELLLLAGICLSRGRDKRSGLEIWSGVVKISQMSRTECIWQFSIETIPRLSKPTHNFLPAVIRAPLFLCVVGVVFSADVKTLTRAEAGQSHEIFLLIPLHSHSRSNHLQFFSWFIFIIIAFPLHSWLSLFIYSLIGLFWTMG
jgi:hypothetical protein